MEDNKADAKTYYVQARFEGGTKNYVYMASLTEAQVSAIRAGGVHAVVDSPVAAVNDGRIPIQMPVPTAPPWGIAEDARYITNLILVKLLSVDPLDMSSYNGKDYKYIVQLVDTTDYVERQKRYQRKQAILKDLERRKRDKLEAMQYRELLAGDPEAEALFAELDAL